MSTLFCTYLRENRVIYHCRYIYICAYCLHLKTKLSSFFSARTRADNNFWSLCLTRELNKSTFYVAKYYLASTGRLKWFVFFWFENMYTLRRNKCLYMSQITITWISLDGSVSSLSLVLTLSSSVITYSSLSVSRNMFYPAHIYRVVSAISSTVGRPARLEQTFPPIG